MLQGTHCFRSLGHFQGKGPEPPSALLAWQGHAQPGGSPAQLAQPWLPSSLWPGLGGPRLAFRAWGGAVPHESDSSGFSLAWSPCPHAPSRAQGVWRCRGGRVRGWQPGIPAEALDLLL